jgi:hypothetical protein
MVEQCAVVSGSWSLKRGDGVAMESENGLAVCSSIRQLVSQKRRRISYGE